MYLTTEYSRHPKNVEYLGDTHRLACGTIEALKGVLIETTGRTLRRFGEWQL